MVNGEVARFAGCKEQQRIRCDTATAFAFYSRFAGGAAVDFTLYGIQRTSTDTE